MHKALTEDRQDRYVEHQTKRSRVEDISRIILDKGMIEKPDDSEFTEEDNRKVRETPGWRYLKSYQTILDKICSRHSGLFIAVKEAATEE